MSNINNLVYESFNNIDLLDEGWINDTKEKVKKYYHVLDNKAKKSSDHLNKNYPKSSKVISKGLKTIAIANTFVPLIPGGTTLSFSLRKFVDHEGTNKDIRINKIRIKKLIRNGKKVTKNIKSKFQSKFQSKSLKTA